MSRVFLATERTLDRKVVIKVLLPELAAGVNVERFRREIQLAAQLQHPHIVPLLSAGEAEGLPYFVMPFVSGESLRTRVAREGEFPISETLRILRDVVSALAYAHARGVVHRDVKPDNVLLSGGVAVVTDFGVAKAVSISSGSGEATSLTSHGVALGTPAYMAPEQATATPNTDHRADIYALGIVAYEMLTGSTPFTGRSVQQVLAAQVVEEPEPVERRRPAVPPLLASLVRDCLAKRPADRPQTAADVMYVLDAIATPSGGTAATTAVRRPATATMGRGRRTAAIVTALGLALLLGGGVLWLRHSDSPPAAGSSNANPATASLLSTDSLSAPTKMDRAQMEERPAPSPARLDDSTHIRVDRNPVEPRPPRNRPTPPAQPQPAAVAPLEPQPAVIESTVTAPVAAAPPAPTPPAAPIETAPAVISRPAPAPPARPVDPMPEIRRVVGEYARAIESRSLADLRRTYPGMTAMQQRGWEQFFQLVRDVKAQLSVSRLDVSNDAAEAQVSGTYTYMNTSTGKAESQPVAFHASLSNQSGQWRISQIR